MHCIERVKKKIDRIEADGRAREGVRLNRMKCQTSSVFIYLFLSNKLCVHVWVLLSIYHSEWKSVCTCVYVRIYLCVYLPLTMRVSVHLSIYLLVYLCAFFYLPDCVCVLRICVSIYLSICVGVSWCVCVCVCLHISIYPCVCVPGS
jgi:hypothetical protein